jgi:hypothetical protein
MCAYFRATCNYISYAVVALSLILFLVQPNVIISGVGMDKKMNCNKNRNEWIRWNHWILARIGSGAVMEPQQPNEALIAPRSKHL